MRNAISQLRPLLLLATLALGGCDVTSAGLGGAGVSVASSGASLIEAPLARAYASSRSMLSSSRTAIGNVLGGSDDKSVVAAAGNTDLNDPALAGLIGSRLGAVLAPEDRRYAYQAQLDALNRGAPGAPTPWRNPVSGHYGNIVPGPAYEQKGLTCRGYSHTVSVNGALDIARGTACRPAVGGWTAAG